jgi:hypothetical protein
LIGISRLGIVHVGEPFDLGGLRRNFPQLLKLLGREERSFLLEKTGPENILILGAGMREFMEAVSS